MERRVTPTLPSKRSWRSRAAALAIVALVSGRGIVAAQPASQGALDTEAIAKAIGKAGQMAGEVYKVTLPRTDLQVSVDGISIRPALALTTWVAFKAAQGAAVAHGDLVLTEAEVNPVLRALRQDAIDVTAIHNHLLNESPRVIYVHFWGHGPADRLAAAMHRALALTATPFTAQRPAGDYPALNADRIQQALGLKGQYANGVLSMSRPRPETITMMGVTLPPSMGMATSINVQAADAGKVAATGDFVLTGDEVNRVLTALRQADIQVTALHNHMIDSTPVLYFMHFWAHDTEDRVAGGLKAALDQMRK